MNIKNLSTILLCNFITLITFAQAPNPYVTNARFSQAPLFKLTGNQASFFISNSGGPTSSKFFYLDISLVSVKPANFKVSDMTGDGAGFFDWTYNDVTNVITGTLNKTLGQNAAGQIYINNLSLTWTQSINYPLNLLGVAISSQGTTFTGTCPSTSDHAFAQTYTSIALLPVVLSSFTGVNNNCKADLKWTTASEINDDYYEIQQSSDQVLFTTINKVKSINSNGNTNNYKSSNSQPDELCYYRLKITDKDGTFKYSMVIPVKTDCSLPKINVYPNPVIDVVTINNIPLAALVTLNSADNKLMLKVTTDNSQIKINMSKYPTGNYILQVTSKDKAISTTTLFKK